MSGIDFDATDPKLKLLKEQVTNEITRQGDKIAAQGQQIDHLKEWSLEHERLLKGENPDKPGLITHSVLIEQRLKTVIENQQSEKKFRTSVLFLLLSLLIGTAWQVMTSKQDSH